MKSYYSTKRQLKEDVAGYLFISPWFIAFFAFAVIPIGMSLYYSLTSYDILTAPVFVGLSNFRRMMADDMFWKALTVTFNYVFIAIPLRLIFAFFLASMFKRGTKMVRFYQAAYYIPSLVGGSIAVSVMWRRMFAGDGLFNTFLQTLGINSTTSWIGSADTALGVIILLAVWQFGSPMLIFLAGLRQIPKSYYEAASIDGAGWISQFFRITLPQMTPIIFFNLIMQTISGFTAFNQAFIISGGRGDPQNSTLFYALYLYMRAFAYFEMGFGAALAWVLVLIIAVFTAIIFKTSDRWVHYES